MPAQAKKPAQPTKTKTAKKTLAKTLDCGMMVPDFTMPSTDGVMSRKSLKGRPFILYFYPKDNTSGCTVQACDFRDSMTAFNKLGITVIGVSKDSIESHEKFRTKYKLTFPLASDAETTICEAFGVWAEKSMYGKKYWGILRTTFLIDGTGKIHGIWHNVKIPGHIEEVKKMAKGLSK